MVLYECYVYSSVYCKRIVLHVNSKYYDCIVSIQYNNLKN